MATVLDGRNRANDSEAASFVGAYVDLQVELEEALATEKAAFDKKVASIRGKAGKEMQSVLDDAKTQGVKKTLVKAIAGEAKLARQAQRLKDKAEGIYADLDDDDAQFAKGIRESLGDNFASFGLGAAAVAAEEEDDADDEQDATTAGIIDAVKSDEAANGTLN